ncbi:MAG: proline iminopeptidase-family hydrolase [Kofleriaceae bacterium]
MRIALWVLCLVACGAAPATTSSYFTNDPGLQTGGVKMIPIHTPKGNFTVWTKRVGHGPIKVLLLHGGPAATHEYMEVFESFFPAAGIEFYEYDQLGSFYSDQPNDDDLWTTDRFVDEVEQVRTALGLDHFYILGHSWGGILAMEYAQAHQEHLAGLIISNMMMSVPDYLAYSKVLEKTMDPKAVARIHELEATGKTDDPEYETLLGPFYAEHICRIDPFPNPVVRAFGHLNKHVYTLMQGPSELGVSGRLEHYDRTKDLGKITVPTLTISGEHDTMDPKHMAWIATQVKQGTTLATKGSHLAMYDDQETYFRGVIGFLHAVHDGSFKPGMQL